MAKVVGKPSGGMKKPKSTGRATPKAIPPKKGTVKPPPGRAKPGPGPVKPKAAGAGISPDVGTSYADAGPRPTFAVKRRRM